LYRQTDVEQVLRIKQLVFGEGLTLAGARRRLEEAEPPAGATDDEVADVLEALAADARTRIAHVRDGLRSILKVLSNAPGTVVVVDDFELDPPPVAAGTKARPAPGRAASRASSRASRTVKPKRSSATA